MSNPFFEQVYSIIARIPYGKVVSYGQIAHMCGRPGSAREVGRALRYCPEKLPWQRVVMSNGAITGGGYAQIRRAMLESESVPFLSNGNVDISTCRWDGRSSE